ncbi:MAG: hypothetical protein IT196_21765 [Acidimicrobiales bacterium]|nr:hypothetical protein [Acidimicrobiales bacterium]
MLNPSIVELLNTMADALRDTVLPELAPGPAHDQLRDAVALTRRIAHAVPLLPGYLHADTTDLARTLDGLAPPERGTGRAAALPVEPPRSLDELIRANLALRDEAAALARRIDLGSTEAAELRAMLLRMVDREESLRLSPWARLPRR